jgi:DNA polymerase elongation subunit (family B)
MLTRTIRPSGDVRGTFTELLRALTSMRIAAKRDAVRAGTEHERSKLDATQSSLKILINSFYGYLGYSRALFNDYEKADEVTQAGQNILRTMIAVIQQVGGSVVEVDTDGIFFVPPATARTEETQQEFLGMIASALPEGITVALDGSYSKMLSYKKKNYALVERDGSLRIKGSSLTSRSMERLGENLFVSAYAICWTEISQPFTRHSSKPGNASSSAASM